MASVDPVRIARRLARRYEPGCWIGVVVHAIAEADSDVDGESVRTPDHYLGAAWSPAPGPMPRFPDIVVIGSPGSDNALAELFVHLPPDAKLWLAGRDEVDVALVAEILLANDANLEPYHRAALEAFVATERSRTSAIIASRYSDGDGGFERFRARIVGTRHRPSR
jgi:hypothetical protein